MQNDDLFTLRDDVRELDEDTLYAEGGAPPAALSPDVGALPDTDTIQRPLPDPFVDNMGIEYWIWNGSRLVPAWPDEVERMRAGEDLRAERAKQALEERAARRLWWRRVLTRLGAAAACVRRFFGIPPALLPPPERRPRERPLQPEE